MKQVLVLLLFLACVQFCTCGFSNSSLARDGEDDGEGNEPICGKDCILYVKGFDITGTGDEKDLGPMSLCDCIKACFQNKDTCANYVWKFTDVGQTQRQCTLYSTFNVPPDASVGGGAQVPSCTVDNQVGSKHDKKCVSGPVWYLDNGSVIC